MVAASRTFWLRMVRLGDRTWIPFLALFILHLSVPPSWLLDVRAITVDEHGVVTLIRQPGYDGVRALYVDELVGANGTTCSDWGYAPYEDRPNNTVRFALGAGFEPCLADRPVAYTARWRPLLFGVLPLREITLRAEIN